MRNESVEIQIIDWLHLEEVKSYYWTGINGYRTYQVSVVKILGKKTAQEERELNQAKK